MNSRRRIFDVAPLMLRVKALIVPAASFRLQAA